MKNPKQPLRFNHCAKGNRTGFTLVELIVVIVILAIISVVVVPNTSNLYKNANLKAGSDKIKDDLRYIYEYAISRHDTTWMVVDMANNSYGIYVGSSPTNRQLLEDPSSNSTGIYDFDTELSGVIITSVDFGGSNEFFYDWWGTPSSGGTIVLNNTKIIKVTDQTGYVHED